MSWQLLDWMRQHNGALLHGIMYYFSRQFANTLVILPSKFHGALGQHATNSSDIEYVSAS